MAFAEVDLSNAIARNASLSSYHAHQISDLDAIARTDGHEEARHPAPGGLSSRSSGLGNGQLMRISLATL